MCHVTIKTLQWFNTSPARNKWAAFDKCVGFQTRQDTINTVDEFKNLSVLTLSDIACNCFEPNMNTIQNIFT